MNRRGFFKALAGVALVAATPLKYIAPIAHQRIVEALSFSDLVSIAFRKHASEIAANIQSNNALFKQLSRKQ